MLIPWSRDDLCITFANTLFWRGTTPPTETLQAPADLLAWLEKSAGLAADEMGAVAAWSHEHPKKAATLFADAIAIREAVFRIFAHLAGG